MRPQQIGKGGRGGLTHPIALQFGHGSVPNPRIVVADDGYLHATIRSARHHGNPVASPSPLPSTDLRLSKANLRSVKTNLRFLKANLRLVKTDMWMLKGNLRSVKTDLRDFEPGCRAVTAGWPGSRAHRRGLAGKFDESSVKCRGGPGQAGRRERSFYQTDRWRGVSGLDRTRRGVRQGCQTVGHRTGLSCGRAIVSPRHESRTCCHG